MTIINCPQTPTILCLGNWLSLSNKALAITLVLTIAMAIASNALAHPKTATSKNTGNQSATTLATTAAPSAVSIPSIATMAPDLPFEPFFVSAFDDLMQYYWQESGNWIGDMQNDATSFAPELLYRVEAYVGEQAAPLYDWAYKTSTYEYSVIFNLIESLLRGNFEMWEIFDAAVGGYSYVSCSEFARGRRDDLCDLFLLPVLNLGSNLLISPLYEAIGTFDEMSAVVFSRAAQINIQIYQSSGKERYLTQAEKLLEKMERLTNEDDNGFYEGSITGWSQASPMVAYATLYAATGNEDALEKVEKITAYHDELFLFGEEGISEAYWEYSHIDIESGDGRYVLAASTHVQYFEAFTLIYEATGNEYYHTRAERFLRFGVNELYLEDKGARHDIYLNYVRNIPHLTHDITWFEEDNNHTGTILSSDYCTGETFNFLRIYWRYLLAEQKWSTEPEVNNSVN